MPPIRTPRRQRTTQSNPFYTPRRSSISSASSKATTSTIGGRSIRRSSRLALTNTGATNVLTRALKKNGKKVKKEGRKKKVKISPRFKKMVNQVLSAKGPVGLMTESVPHSVIHLVDNLQQVVFASERSFQGVTGWAFTPTYINYVYDKLYCNGTLPLTPYANVDRYSSSFNDNQQIHVLEQYYIVKLKNNTARTVELKLWDVSPKSCQDGTIFVNLLEILNAGTSDTGPVGGVGKGTQGRENPSGCSPYTIGWKPTLMSSFNKQYSLDETIIKLEPGKEYYHKVKGPNDKMYKYNMYKKNGYPVDVLPFTKCTLIVANTDLTATSLIGGSNPVGRWTDMSFTGPFGILSETQFFTKIKCPDQTGFQRLATLPAAGTVQELSQKGYAYIIKNWYNSQEGLGGVVDIEDENPQAQAVNGL